MLLRSQREMHWSRGEGEDSRGVRIRDLLGKPEGAHRIRLRLVDIRPGGRSDYHARAQEHQIFVLEGEGFVRTPEGEGEVHAGDALLVAAGEPHQLLAGDTGLRLIIATPLDGEEIDRIGATGLPASHP